MDTNNEEKQNRDKAVTIRLNHWIIRDVEEICARYDLTFNHVVKNAITFFLEKYKTEVAKAEYLKGETPSKQSLPREEL